MNCAGTSMTRNWFYLPQQSKDTHLSWYRILPYGYRCPDTSQTAKSLHNEDIDAHILWISLFVPENERGRIVSFILPFARSKTFAFQANSFSLFCILNIEQRISNSRSFKKIGEYSSLRYSAVPCSAVLRFKIDDFQLQ